MIEIDYTNESRRDVLCIDVKSFFASVESVKLGLHPLKSELVVMSRGDKKGGLVLAASPVVKKKYGIKTGSRKFDFPKNHSIIIVPPRMELYVKVNKLINNIFQKYASSEDVHAYSIDEAFVDITNSKHLFGETSFDVARKIQDEVWKELRLVVAVGIGDNPLLAKLALDNEAKDCQSQIATWHYEDVKETIWKIPKLTDMWGIGKRTEVKLNSIGIYSIYDLSQADRILLKNKMGVIGQQLFYHAHGIDRSVISEKEKLVIKNQSIGNSQVLERNYLRIEEIELIIREMTINLCHRLRSQNQYTSCITLQIGYAKDVKSKPLNKQINIEATDVTATIINYFINLFRSNYERKSVRSVSVSFSKLGEPIYPQLDLFNSIEKEDKNKNIDLVMDTIKEQFGKTSIVTANSLKDAGTYIKRSKLLGGHQSDTES